MFKKFITKAFAFLLCAVMLATCAPLDGFVFEADAMELQVGDIIEFGMYPQSRVRDNDTIATLNSIDGEWISYGYYSGSGVYPYTDGRMAPGDYMRYKDVVWGSDKYRAVVFDTYRPHRVGWETNTSYNETPHQFINGYGYGNVYWFRYEPIKWRVLNPETGMVMAETVIDCQPFNNYILKSGTNKYGDDLYWGDSSKIYYANNYAQSSIRKWLNNDFYNTAFTAAQQSIIKYTFLDNSCSNSSYSSEATYDKVYLLSYDDVFNSDYGFKSGSGSTGGIRAAMPSDYSECHGVYVYSGGSYRDYYPGFTTWNLRTASSGTPTRTVCMVWEDGKVTRYVGDVDQCCRGIRPAINLNINTTKIYNSYSVRTVDSVTGSPISGASVTFDGKLVGTTGADGSFTLKIGEKEDLNKQVSFSKSGYTIETRRLYELNAYVINNISMQNGFDLSQFLAKLQFEKETVTGPSVTILGKTFSFFSFEAGIDISDVSFKVNQDTNDKKIRYILGIGDGVEVDNNSWFLSNFKEFKEFYSYFSNSDINYRYNKIRNKLKKFDGSVGFESELSVAGYIEFDYSTGDLIFKEGGLVVLSESAVSQDVPFAYICYATFKIKCSSEFKLYLEREEVGVFQPSATIGITATPSLGLGARLVSKDVASIEAGINGRISGQVSFPASVLREGLTLNISASFYVKAKALWALEAEWSKTLNCNLYPNFGDVTINSAEDVIDYNDFEPIARDYMNAIQIETQSIDETLNKYSVYPYADPQLVELNDGRIVALWLGDNGTKSTMNLTTLYYSVYESGTWSAPAAVYESGLADNEPKIATDGEKVYALWQRGNEVFTDDSSLDYMLAHIDLVYSEFDGIWTEPVAIGNSGSGMYPIAHGIAAENNTVAITWAENSKNFAEGTDGAATIFSQLLTDDVWSEVQEKDQCDNISSLAIGYYYGEPMVAYTVDTDGDTTTTNDNELFLDSMQITYDDVDDYNVTYQNGQFYYLSDGYLSCFDSFIDGDLYVGNDYKVLSNGTTTAVVYPVTDGYHSELYVAYEENDGYSSPVALTSIGKHIADYSAIIDSENTIVAAMTVRNIDENATGYPYTSTDFIVDNIGQLADLEMSEIVYYDTDSVVAGNKLTFTTTIKNIGTAAVNGYTVNIKDLSGTLVAAREYDGGIASGETIEATVIYTLPDDFRKQTFTVEVVANDDGNESNNTATVEIGCADIEVVSCEIQDGKIVATVTNKGYETVTGAKADISRFTTQSNILGTIAIGEIEPGEVETIEYILPASQLAFDTPYSSNRFIIEVKSDTEEISSVNNSAEVLYSPKAVEAISLNTSELTIDIGSTHQLLATVAPFDAYNKVVHWVSDSTNIVEVDEYTGELTAVSGGTAIITAITDDGGYVSQCVVTVNVPVSGIELDKTSIIIGVGRSSSVTVSFTPENASNKNILWSSADTNIVTVNNGEIFGKNVGETIVTAKTKDGNYTAMCIVRVIEVLPSNDSKTVVDNINKHIYGLDAGIDSLDNYVTVSNEDCILEYEPTKKGFGTGTIVLLTINGEIVDNYTVVIFGDVNGDGWYDGEDAFMVNLIAQGILDEDDVGTAIWTAADCNHDSVIDDADVDLLTSAGLLLNNVDQSSTAVELEPNAAYIEYMGLIDQNFSIGTDNSTAQPDNETTASEFDFEIIIAEVFEFIKSILVFIFSFIV